MKNNTLKILTFSIIGIVLFVILLLGCNSSNISNSSNASDNSTISKEIKTNIEEDNKNESLKVAEQQMSEADKYYRKLVQVASVYEFELTSPKCNITGSTDKSYLGGNDNYEANLSYIALYNEGKNHGFYNLKIIIENRKNGDKIIPLGYTAVECATRNSAFDNISWVKIDKDSVLGTPVSNTNNSSYDNNVNNNYKYFQYSNGELKLKNDISYNKSNSQDIINELYAIKGYKFKEEPYKSEYNNKELYPSNIDDMDSIVLNKSEKELLDDLVNIEETWTNSVITRDGAIEIIKKEKNIDPEYSDIVSDIEGNLDIVKNGIIYYEIEVVSLGGRGAASTYYVSSKTGEIFNYSDLK